MSLLSLFSGGGPDPKQVVDEAIAREKKLGAERQALELQRQEKMMRQVELWSIMNLSYELEEEYHDVTGTIAELVKHIAAIDEFVARLRSARMECRDQAACEHIRDILGQGDPWEIKLRSGKAEALPAILPSTVS